MGICQIAVTCSLSVARLPRSSDARMWSACFSLSHLRFSMKVVIPCRKNPILSCLMSTEDNIISLDPIFSCVKGSPAFNDRNANGPMTRNVGLPLRAKTITRNVQHAQAHRLRRITNVPREEQCSTVKRKGSPPAATRRFSPPLRSHRHSRHRI